MYSKERWLWNNSLLLFSLLFYWWTTSSHFSISPFLARSPPQQPFLKQNDQLHINCRSYSSSKSKLYMLNKTNKWAYTMKFHIIFFVVFYLLFLFLLHRTSGVYTSSLMSSVVGYKYGVSWSVQKWGGGLEKCVNVNSMCAWRWYFMSSW